MEELKYQDFLQSLINLGHRQGAVEIEARKLIKSTLQEYKVDFEEFNFETIIPDYQHASVLADGIEVPCLPTGLKSGEVTDTYHLISSLISSQQTIDLPNINFNPRCLKSISQSNFYHAPSWAINVKDIQTLVNAREVKAVLEVAPQDHTSAAILVGNTQDPQNIVFTHYDSIGPGAIDNASGTYTVLRAILENPETLKNTLYVLDGNEEISYDYSIYWGHGYREFEKKYLSQMNNAEKIFVVDSLGNTSTEISNDPHLVKLGFPVKNFEKMLGKVSFLMGDFDDLMKVYQSPIDLLSRLKKEYLDEAQEMLISNLAK